MPEFEMEWDAPEYEYHEKTISWYWVSIIIAACIVAFSVWEKNFLFGLFIVVAEVLFIIWGNRTPRVIHFQMTSADIVIDGRKHHSLKEFELMSVDDLHNGWNEVVFIFRAKLKTPLKIIVPENRIEEFRNALKPLIKETPYEPTLLDSIEKLLRF